MNANDPPSPQSPPTIRGHESGNLSISMNNGNANIPRSALSPVSVAGSDWSGIKNYNSPENDLMFGGPPSSNPMSGRHNVSPPASIARSSDGTGLYASSEGSVTLKNIALEEQVALHHTALAKWLRDFLRTKGSIRPNRARDKLLRLSVIQFQELSTDVYDELQRREPGSTGEEIPEGDTPPFLPPKPNFHEKRNQARQKLSTLPAERFRDLATDVFYELERRFPRFQSGLIPPITSPTNSMDGRGIPPMGGRGSPGMPPRMGSPGPMRAGSPGPGMMRPGGPYRPGPNGPPGTPGGTNGYRGAPRGPPPQNAPPGPPRGLMGPDGQNSFGRPLPKTFQNNTIIPNKSTMVEDDDGDDDDDMDAFGLEDNGHRRSNDPGRRESARSMASRSGHDADKRVIAEYQSKVEILHDKVSSLEASLEEKEEELNLFRTSGGGGGGSRDQDHDQQREWDNLRHELEGKLADAENLNNNLRSELDRVKADSAASEQSLQQHVRDLQEEVGQLKRSGGGGGGGDGGSAEYQELLRQHEDLKMDLREQEEVTEEVRKEAMEFLKQMKDISERADESYEREERLHAQIQKLQGDVQEWKARYAKAKTTIRSIRSSTLGLQVPTSGGLFGKEGNLVDANGLVKAVLLTKFQISIDELLKVARGINFHQSLDQVKSVVMATRALTKGLERDQSEAVNRAKSRISATANNLTTAAKNHATGCGLSPVSLLDAAASHLTASVIELVKLVRIRPTIEGESDEEEEFVPEPPNEDSRYEVPVGDHDSSTYHVNGGGSGGHRNSHGHGSNGGNVNVNVPELDVSGAENRLSNDSLYSPLNSPRGSRNGPRSRDGSALLGSTIGTESRHWGSAPPPQFARSEVEELRLFLENQTNAIVESIQSLLEAIKADSSAGQLCAHILSIEAVVGKVLSSTEAAMENHALRDRAEWIVKNLGACLERMVGMRVGLGRGEGLDADGGDRVAKDGKSKLAGLAFDMARETKELVRTVEDIDNENRRQMGVSVGPGVDLS